MLPIKSGRQHIGFSFMFFVVYIIFYIMHSIAYIFGLLHFKIINDILNDVKCATVNGLMPRYMTSYTVCVRYHMSVLVLNCIIFFIWDRSGFCIFGYDSGMSHTV